MVISNSGDIYFAAPKAVMKKGVKTAAKMVLKEHINKKQGPPGDKGPDNFPPAGGAPVM